LTLRFCDKVTAKPISSLRQFVGVDAAVQIMVHWEWPPYLHGEASYKHANQLNVQAKAFAT
jgi:hypothetical protein